MATQKVFCGLGGGTDGKFLKDDFTWDTPAGGVTSANVQAQTYTYYSDTGAADAYVITPSPAIGSYTAGQRFQFLAGAANTGASTLNVSALGVKAIKKQHDQALAAGDIEAGSGVDVMYDGTNFQLMSAVATSPSTSSNPTGTLIMWLTNTAPDGYLLCYGQAVSSGDYAALYAVIGTTFGGDGSPNFNLPDMRGRVPLGQDDMGGASANVVTDAAADTIGGTDGHETHTLTEAELASHTHPQVISSAVTAQTKYDWIYGAQYDGATTGRSLVSTAVTSSSYSDRLPLTTNATGSGTAHNNVQPYITVNYAIKT